MLIGATLPDQNDNLGPNPNLPPGGGAGGILEKEAPKKKFADCALGSLISIVDMLKGENGLNELEHYIDKKLAIPIQNIHESYLDVMVTLLEQDIDKTMPLKQSQDKLIVNFGLFFKILIKFMHQHVQSKKIMKKSKRFSPEFRVNLEKLVNYSCLRMVNVNAGLGDRSVDDERPSSAIQNASRALIYLFRELYWLCEIGFVTNLVSIYLNHEKLNFYEKISLQNHVALSGATGGLHESVHHGQPGHSEFKQAINVGVAEHNKSKILSLAHLRLEALKLLAEHEAWIPLNFPNFGDTDLRFLKLTKRFCDRHYLASELLRLGPSSHFYRIPSHYRIFTGKPTKCQFMKR